MGLSPRIPASTYFTHATSCNHADSPRSCPRAAGPLAAGPLRQGGPPRKHAAAAQLPCTAPACYGPAQTSGPRPWHCRRRRRRLPPTASPTVPAPHRPTGASGRQLHSAGGDLADLVKAQVGGALNETKAASAEPEVRGQEGQAADCLLHGRPAARRQACLPAFFPCGCRRLRSHQTTPFPTCLQITVCEGEVALK